MLHVELNIRLETSWQQARLRPPLKRAPHLHGEAWLLSLTVVSRRWSTYASCFGNGQRTWIRNARVRARSTVTNHGRSNWPTLARERLALHPSVRVAAGRRPTRTLLASGLEHKIACVACILGAIAAARFRENWRSTHAREIIALSLAVRVAADRRAADALLASGLEHERARVACIVRASARASHGKGEVLAALAWEAAVNLGAAQRPHNRVGAHHDR